MGEGGRCRAGGSNICKNRKGRVWGRGLAPEIQIVSLINKVPQRLPYRADTLGSDWSSHVDAVFMLGGNCRTAGNCGQEEDSRY